MRLVTYESSGKLRSGIVIGEQVVDASAAKDTMLNIDADSISNRAIIQWTPGSKRNLKIRRRRLACGSKSIGCVSLKIVASVLPSTTPTKLSASA